MENRWKNSIDSLNNYNALFTLIFIQYKAIMPLPVEWSIYVTAIACPHTNYENAVENHRALIKVLCIEINLLISLPMHIGFSYCYRELNKTFFLKINVCRLGDHLYIFLFFSSTAFWRLTLFEGDKLPLRPCDIPMAVCLSFLMCCWATLITHSHSHSHSHDRKLTYIAS